MLTMHDQQNSQILGESGKPVLQSWHCSTDVPTWATSAPSDAAPLAEWVPMGVFHWGVDSPVSTASSTMHDPASSSTSAGTTRASFPTPAAAGGSLPSAHTEQ